MNVHTPSSIEPCADVQEVFDLASRLLESFGPAHEIERLLDGVTRFPGQGHRQAPALLRRARSKVTAEDVRRHFAAMLLTWLGQAASIRLDRQPHMETFLSRRLAELQDRLRAGPQSFGLHSLPETSYGWLSAERLTTRLVSQPEPLDWDFVQALLRVRQGPVPPRLERMGGSAAACLRYILGDARERPRCGLWWEAATLVRAARQKPPLCTLTVDPLVEIMDGRLFRWRDQLTLVIPELRQWDGAGLCFRHNTRTLESLRWQALIAPALREPYQWLGLERMGFALMVRGQAPDLAYLEVLFDPEQTWEGSAPWLAAAGLASPDTVQRGLAIDAVADGVSRQRLRGELIGQGMALLTATGLSAKRWAKSFQELRGFVPSMPLFQALQAFFSLAPADYDGRLLLDPMLEAMLSAGASLEDGRARLALQRWRGKSKTESWPSGF